MIKAKSTFKIGVRKNSGHIWSNLLSNPGRVRTPRVTTPLMPHCLQNETLSQHSKNNEVMKNEEIM